MSGANAPAPNALPQDQKGAEQRSQEPSMEEILASIRRIISDDQMLPLSPRASVPPLPPGHAAGPSGAGPAAPTRDGETDAASVAREPDHHGVTPDRHEHDDVLDLADVAHGEHDRESSHRTHDDAPDESEPADEPAPPMMTIHQDPPLEPATAPAIEAPPSAAARRPAAAESRFEAKHEPLVSDNTVASVSSSFHQLAATMLMQNFPPVDQIARELLRPMIKTWLDDNLPVMVERLVRAEIERVARVGR